MRFDIELSDRADLVEEGFDVAVRIGAIGSQNLVGRQVGARSSSAARRRLPRAPRRAGKPEDLAAHVCLTYEYAPARKCGRFATRRAATQRPDRGPIHANNGRFLEALAVEGVGIAYEPDFIVGPDVRAGRLVPDPARVRAAGDRHLRRLPQPRGTCRRRCAHSPTSWSSASASRRGHSIARPRRAVPGTRPRGRAPRRPRDANGAESCPATRGAAFAARCRVRISSDAGGRPSGLRSYCTVEPSLRSSVAVERRAARP